WFLDLYCPPPTMEHGTSMLKYLTVLRQKCPCYFTIRAHPGGSGFATACCVADDILSPKACFCRELLSQ
ncbi:MAG: hypothetical protein MUP16_07355, partial [Sedimentisphaerales bacterium]|nr:hypothetical protein [Sedimentisphaerales bacterium]